MTNKKCEAIAIIPARGGSKGISRKNLRLLANEPLLVHSIRTAQNCPYIKRCFVSTEDEEIAAIAKDCGAEIIVRPHDLATDQAAMESVIIHALQTLSDNQYHIAVLLQPTSPLRTQRHIAEAIMLIEKEQCRSVVSVVRAKHHPLKSMRLVDRYLFPAFDEKSLTAQRQQLPELMYINGAIYTFYVDDFIKAKSFFIQPVLPYFMSSLESVDIDDEEDFFLCELLLNHSFSYPPLCKKQ